MRLAEGSEHARPPGLEQRRARPELARPVDALADRVLGRGGAAEEGALGAGDRALGARQHPRRRALKDGHVRDLVRDLRDELDRARAGADDRDALARQIDVVVPASGVEHISREVHEAGDVGQLGLDQRAGGGDQRARPDGAARGIDLVAVALPARVEQLAAELDVGQEVFVASDAPEVGMDLRLVRVGARPVRVLREGEGVDVAGDVTGRAGVGVVAPDTADVVGALDDHEVLAPRPLELRAHGQAGEPGAHDHHVRLPSYAHVSNNAVTCAYAT